MIWNPTGIARKARSIRSGAHSRPCRASRANQATLQGAERAAREDKRNRRSGARKLGARKRTGARTIAIADPSGRFLQTDGPRALGDRRAATSSAIFVGVEVPSLVPEMKIIGIEHRSGLQCVEVGNAEGLALELDQARSSLRTSGFSASRAVLMGDAVRCTGREAALSFVRRQNGPGCSPNRPHATIRWTTLRRLKSSPAFRKLS